MHTLFNFDDEETSALVAEMHQLFQGKRLHAIMPALMAHMFLSHAQAIGVDLESKSESDMAMVMHQLPLRIQETLIALRAAQRPRPPTRGRTHYEFKNH